MDVSHILNDDEFDQILLSIVREGRTDTLGKHLLSVENPNWYLNKLYGDSQNQKFTILMMACLNGHDDVIRMLLEHFQPDLEIPNNIALHDANQISKMYFDVSVLWVAAALDKFSIVKLFIEHGANVNYRTKTQSTPLRCSCRQGNIDMIRYLIENGADIHAKNENNETILMICANYGHVNLVKLFVDKYQLDVNQCDDNGRSALYDAVESESLEITKILLEHGATNFQSKIDQKSPLLRAAEKRCVDIMNFISKYCPLIEEIDAKEFYASNIIIKSNAEDTSNHEIAFEYLSKALQLRLTHNLPKSLQSDPIATFDYRQECQTLEQLKEIRFNADHMHIEALLILERTLGPNHEKYHRILKDRAAELARLDQYEKALNLWIYELSLSHQYSMRISYNQLHKIVSLICQMLTESISVTFKNIFIFLTVLIKVIDQDMDKYHYNLKTLLYLITIIAKFSNEISTDEKDQQRLHQCIFKFNRSRQRVRVSREDFYLLGMSLDEWTFIKDYHIEKICQYPCFQTAHLLIQCGADVSESDQQGNTPLHQFALNDESSDAESILKLLLDAGAHVDYVNYLNQTPFDLATTDMLKHKLKNQMQLNSLKCLCARFIRQNKVPFREYLSVPLIIFLMKH